MPGTTLVAMPYEIVSTQFVAHADDLAEAQALHRKRAGAAAAEVLALSEKPKPLCDPFQLWNLRCEAAYAGLPEPEAMQLYELKALVDFGGRDRDDAVDDFFFEGLNDPTRFPAFIDGIDGLIPRDPITGPLTFITAVYLGQGEYAAVAHELYESLLRSSHVVAYSPALEPLDTVQNADLVGELWVRDATLNVTDRGDGYFSPGKTPWAGYFLTCGDPRCDDPRAVERIDGGVVVLSRLSSEPF